MLEDGRKNLPKAVFTSERFEIPKVMGHLQGNRTILSNFLQIATKLRRPAEHMLKFILKELAAPGEIKKSGSVIIGTKVSASKINDKIRLYARQYVLCPECGKPDTKIIKESNLTFIKCHACGARHSLKSKI